ncbi:hypothetical protein LPJ57_009709, partial [Coemansia sp. RSA 486]
YGKAKDVVEFLIVNASAMYPTLAIQRQSVVFGPSDGRKTSADDYVFIGGSENLGRSNQGNASVVRGAGLVVFDLIGRNSQDKEPGSSDGSAAMVSGPQPEHSQSTGDLETMPSTPATGRSAGVSASPLQPQLTPTQPPPPPRGDSLVTMGMAMSTPVMGTATSVRASQMRSLGSVTARLYDPSLSSSAAMAPVPAPAPASVSVPASAPALAAAPLSSAESSASPFLGSSGSGWNSNRSSTGLSIIQYENTGSSQQISRADISSAGGQRRISSHARPRRSMSFIMPPTSPDSNENDAVADRLSKDMMSRSTNAVHARRAAGDRRTATYSGVEIGGQGSDNMISGMVSGSSRPLPPVPVSMAGRAASATSSAGGFHMYPLPGQRSRQSPAVAAARLQPGHAVYQPSGPGYPTATTQGIDTGRGAVQQQQQQMFVPAAYGSEEVARDSWYSEVTPSEETGGRGFGVGSSESVAGRS